ncbi:hypothetical protein TRSC58_07249 [Trypanosoma rangeli SC58]|uniref:Uncharacterized protein n=1 Tax=Trypanosoma rangeli SC58 TaxID=429131 RepID=A0A061IS58_TRYRA|nr:hypothetical protein TRSC58_07249 [Trypanosoma rangeli SC58]
MFNHIAQSDCGSEVEHEQADVRWMPWTLLHMLAWFNVLLSDEHVQHFDYCTRSVAFRVASMREVRLGHVDRIKEGNAFSLRLCFADFPQSSLAPSSACEAFALMDLTRQEKESRKRATRRALFFSFSFFFWGEGYHSSPGGDSAFKTDGPLTTVCVYDVLCFSARPNSISFRLRKLCRDTDIVSCPDAQKKGKIKGLKDEASNEPLTAPTRSSLKIDAADECFYMIFFFLLSFFLPL